MGSCDGTLVATVDGLSYVTSNKGDAFALAFGQMEIFAVDYMEKNLRVKQRNGKTWNFTDKSRQRRRALRLSPRSRRRPEEARRRLYTC